MSASHVMYALVMGLENQESGMTTRGWRLQAVKPENSNQTQSDKQEETVHSKGQVSDADHKHHEGSELVINGDYFRAAGPGQSFHDHSNHTAQAASNFPAS